MLSVCNLLWVMTNGSMCPTDPKERPGISLDKLKKEIPEFDWSKGHSGALLPEDIVKKLEEIDDEEEDDFPLAN